jgi:hypothetical protein
MQPSGEVWLRDREICDFGYEVVRCSIRRRYNFWWLPSHIGFRDERLHAQNQTSADAVGLNSTGTNFVVLWEPSQNGWALDNPHAHHQ